MQTNLDELMQAIELLSFGGANSAEGYLCRQTGAIFLDLGEIDEGDEIPEDASDGSKYLPLPHFRDLQLGADLAVSFTEHFLPSSLPMVREQFRHRGAYSRFKHTLDEAGLLDQWFAYEQDAQRSALRAWLRSEGVELTD